MNNRLSLKFAVAAVLVGIVVMRWPEASGPFTIGVLAFGLANVFFEPPGTFGVRAGAVAAIALALLLPDLKILVAIGAWLVWLPAFTAAYSVGARQARIAASGGRQEPDEPPALPSQIAVAAIIVAVAIASIAYRLLFQQRLEQTAALFVGLPALIAVVVVFTVSPQSATGVALKAVAVGLLVSLTLLWEGMLCVAMSAPIFFAVAVAVAKGVETAQMDQEHGRLYSCLVLLAIVPFTLEGVTPLTTIDRRETVTATKIVSASADEVARALFESPRFERIPSRFLRVGFPRATASRIECHTGRLQWIVTIRGGEMKINGMEPRVGELVLELAERRPGFVRWRAVSDTSHVTHFLDWREAIVEWQAVDAQTTRVRWTVRYDRGLDPAWYFGPFERYAVGLATGYLIDTVAAP